MGPCINSPRREGGREVLQIYGQGGFNGSSAHNDVLALHHPFDDTERIVDGALHLITVEVIGAAENDRSSRSRFGS